VLDEVALAQEAITEVRRIRGEMRIPFKVHMELLVDDDALLGRLRKHEAAIFDVAKVRIGRLGERPKGAAAAVLRGVEMVLPLDGIIDFAEELARLDKVIAKVEKEIIQLDKRAGNKRFIDNAPAEVVAEVRAKRDAATNKLETLNASRNRIKDAL
jgi:valyl-tRNA synthetase